METLDRTNGPSATSSRRKTLGLVLVLIGVTAVTGLAAWWMSPREFRGRLAYTPRLVGIPEDPPALAHLITATGTYELSYTSAAVDRTMHRKLTELNGKPVIIRGKWGYRRTMNRRHRAILVYEIRLATSPATSQPATAPAPPAPSPAV